MSEIRNPQWLPVGNDAATKKDDAFWEKALKVSSQKIELLAANIANADTPGFKAATIDFAEALEAATSRGTELAATTTHARHLSTQRAVQADLLVTPRTALQPAIDGNTVDLDVERAEFAEATVRHEFTLKRAIGEYQEQANWVKTLT